MLTTFISLRLSVLCVKPLTSNQNQATSIYLPEIFLFHSKYPSMAKTKKIVY